jgi:hypothetical protein
LGAASWVTAAVEICCAVGGWFGAATIGTVVVDGPCDIGGWCRMVDVVGGSCCVVRGCWCSALVAVSWVTAAVELLSPAVRPMPGP